jgi:hypothetical protein
VSVGGLTPPRATRKQRDRVHRRSCRSNGQCGAPTGLCRRPSKPSARLRGPHKWGGFARRRRTPEACAARDPRALRWPLAAGRRHQGADTYRQQRGGARRGAGNECPAARWPAAGRALQCLAADLSGDVTCDVLTRWRRGGCATLRGRYFSPPASLTCGPNVPDDEIGRKLWPKQAPMFSRWPIRRRL